jgi:regulator of sigma E protease
MLVTILATLIALGVLVTVHEFGHYWVARRCGVKVLRFSVGFGRPLWTRVDRHGTEFCVAAIPLGGYVKMLDGRETEIPAHLAGQAFDQQPLAQRAAIVAAGPLINLGFAAVLYAVISALGVTVAIPVIGSLPETPRSPSEYLPAELLAVDGVSTTSWERASVRLVDAIGESPTIRLTIRPVDSSIVRDVMIPVPRNMQSEQSPLAMYGIQPWRPAVTPTLAMVQPDGAGALGGLRVGDTIVQVNEQVIQDWQGFVDLIRISANQTLDVHVDREGERRIVSITPVGREGASGETIGFVGLAPKPTELPPEMLRVVQSGPIEALYEGVMRTAEMSWLTVKSIGKMITGALSPKNLSGPLTIAQVAGDSASSGWYAYLSFLAYLSVSLGVLNLLPIPVLDGGHLVYFLVEAVRGRPVSEASQMQGIRIGMALLMGLMVFAFYNDVMRLF